MLDVLHLQDTQSYDFKQYFGLGLDIGTSNLDDWIVWNKPRGIKFCYMLGVGGGGSGGGSDTTVNDSGGGGGGGSGAQTAILLPEMFIPDVLYIYAGAGGKGQLNTAGTGINGANTYIAIERYSTFTANLTLLTANGGTGGGGGGAASGGAGGAGGAASTVADMPLCRGAFTSIAGQVGGAGGTTGANAPDFNFPTSGLMVTGGSGGGGGATGGGAGDGGDIIAPTTTLGDTYFGPILGGIGAQGNNAATPGGNGYRSSNYIINVGGAGGGGGSSGNNRPGAIGGDGAPGCGGGGTGAGNPSNPTIKGGEGGPGFVIILCW